MIKGFEADDVIGSMAKRAEKEGFDIYMVTPDKDYGQLISEHIFQFKPGKSGSESEIVDSAKICEKYGISRPEQVVEILNEYLALTTGAIFKNGGTLDKFIGDATMAVFNSPLIWTTMCSAQCVRHGILRPVLRRLSRCLSSVLARR